MKENIFLPGSQVLVIFEETTKTDAGVLVDNRSKPIKKGLVVKVGVGVKNDTTNIDQIKEGDSILFKWSDEVVLEGKKYHVVEMPSVVLVMKKQ